MSGESTYNPGNGFTQWLDTRLPILRLAHDSFIDLPDPEKPQLLVDFRRYFDLLLGDPNHHRHYSCHALHAACRPCL